VDARGVVKERRFGAAQSPPINRGFRPGRPGQTLSPTNPVEFLGVKRENPMPQIRAIFWDVGGVLLTNAWDHVERTEALNHFHLDEAEFHDRHEMEVSSFEQGKITLDEYLDRTVFYRPRTFSREDFKTYMFSLTKPFPEVLELARKLAESGNYLMGTINNESRELNLYRIEKNGLRNIFRVFVSSCFVGLRKPELEIYRMALEITQIPPKQCCFIDDRAPNLDPAAKLGIETIHMQSVDQLKKALSALGVTA
jgi:putative hydrolase of the HAD superfamily